MLPPFTFGRVFTDWSISPVLFVLTFWVLGLYGYGVWLLRRRGDTWSIARTASFVGGLVVFLFATQSGLGTYDTVLLSVHMVQHMLLSMTVPLLLALGAPVTLALRTLPRGPRKALLALLHSGLAKVLTFPPLTLALFVISPWALYFSGWYAGTLHHVWLHELMHVHLVLVGSLFFWPLLGIDPVPGRVNHVFRLLMVFLTLPFHAFLGVTIMGQDQLLAGDWYPSLHDTLPWLPDAHHDQQVAGGILWSAGDAVGLIFFVILFVQWVQHSMREAKREDRRLDRLEQQERVVE